MKSNFWVVLGILSASISRPYYHHSLALICLIRYNACMRPVHCGITVRQESGELLNGPHRAGSYRGAPVRAVTKCPIPDDGTFAKRPEAAIARSAHAKVIDHDPNKKGPAFQAAPLRRRIVSTYSGSTFVSTTVPLRDARRRRNASCASSLSDLAGWARMG